MPKWKRIPFLMWEVWVTKFIIDISNIVCHTNATALWLDSIHLGSGLFVVFFNAGNEAIKVTLICSILQNTKFFKFTLCKGFSNSYGHFAPVLQNIFFIELKERIQTANPILHIHDISTPCLSLGIVQIHRYNLV